MQAPELRRESPAYISHRELPFSLALGGPLYRIYLRTGLARPALELVHRRIVGFSLICWLPLLVLSVLSGNTLGGVAVPFLHDFGVHVRFLIALPLLIGADLIIHDRTEAIVHEFMSRGIIPDREQARFQDLVSSSIRLRDSTFVEVVLAVLVILTGHWIWSQSLTFQVSSWYAVKTAGGPQLTTAGYWYEFVSSTILRFIILRWYFRIFVWYRFLWGVRGLQLHLNFLHPDRVAGLGFLDESVCAFAPILVAQTALIASVVLDRIRHAGATLIQFRHEIGVAVVFLILLVLTPLTFFVVKLARAARMGVREYGTLSSYYVDDFHGKWIKGHRTKGEKLLGTCDIQSLADLGNAYDVVGRMRLVPFTKEAVLLLVAITILPLLPLTLTMLPLEQIIKRLIDLVF